MSAIIDAARAHFRNQLNGGLEKYHVEEWGVDVYFTKTLSFREQSKLIDLNLSGKRSESLLESVIMRCKDENGKPLFTAADKEFLNNEVDPKVILKIVSAFNSADISQGDIEKN